MGSPYYTKVQLLLLGMFLIFVNGIIIMIIDIICTLETLDLKYEHYELH